MNAFSRRRALAALAAGAGLGAFEVASLRGLFDHAHAPPPAARERFAKSRTDAARGTALADGALVHVGHSTHLLHVAGARFLTDPWFYDPAFGALSHTQGPATLPEHVGDLDALLISHDHADHADLRAIDRLDKRARAIVATADLAAKIRALGFAQVDVLRPWEALNIGAAKVTAVPAQHDVYEVGYVVQGAGRSVYFAGDTRLFDGMAEIGERLAPTVAILPVDGTRTLGAALHVMTPDDAVAAARILRAKLVVPSHADAYVSDPFASAALVSTIAAAAGVFASAIAVALPNVRCVVPEAGDVVALPRYDVVRETTP